MSHYDSCRPGHCAICGQTGNLCGHGRDKINPDPDDSRRQGSRGHQETRRATLRSTKVQGEHIVPDTKRTDKVQFFRGRRGLLRRTQYYARVIAPNGEKLITTEGYNNLEDLVELVDRLFPDLPKVGLELQRQGF